MADTLDPLRIEGKGMVLDGASFAPNGSSAVDQTKIVNPGGWISSITRTGVGVFNVKTSRKYTNFVGMVGWGLQLSAVADTSIQFDGFVFGASGVLSSFNVNVLTAGVAADIAANAANRISFALLFSTHEKMF